MHLAAFRSFDPTKRLGVSLGPLYLRESVVLRHPVRPLEDRLPVVFLYLKILRRLGELSEVRVVLVEAVETNTRLVRVCSGHLPHLIFLNVVSKQHPSGFPQTVAVFIYRFVAEVLWVALNVQLLDDVPVHVRDLRNRLVVDPVVC